MYNGVLMVQKMYRQKNESNNIEAYEIEASEYVLTEKFVEDLLKAGHVKRNLFFYKIAARKKSLWGLYSGTGWATGIFETEVYDEQECLYLWPAEEFFEKTEYDRQLFCPKRIEYYDFVKRWIPDLIDEKVAVALFGAEDIVICGNEGLLHLKKILEDTFLEKNGISAAKNHKLQMRERGCGCCTESIDGQLDDSIFRR
jgi:hypothetical protein